MLGDVIPEAETSPLALTLKMSTRQRPPSRLMANHYGLVKNWLESPQNSPKGWILIMLGMMVTLATSRQLLIPYTCTSTLFHPTSSYSVIPHN